MRTWDILIWDICSKTLLATKPQGGCGRAVSRRSWAGQPLMCGRCPERCIYVWQKIRESLKERCKSHKVKTDSPPGALSLHHSSVCRWLSQPHRGLGEGIQFNTKNLEEIAWEGVIKMSYTHSLISSARDRVPPPCQPLTKPESVIIPGPTQTPNVISHRAL